MKFWAIAYQYQEDTFFNVVSKEDVWDLSEQCLLPSEELAKLIIEDRLSVDYIPVEIELETLNQNGTCSYSRGEVKRWDE